MKTLPLIPMAGEGQIIIALLTEMHVEGKVAYGRIRDETIMPLYLNFRL